MFLRERYGFRKDEIAESQKFASLISDTLSSPIGHAP